jgi:hypothetical protein
MNDERKPVWPWNVALLIGLPVLYVASFGPACWIAIRIDGDEDAWNCIYHPVIVCVVNLPDSGSNIAERFLLLGAPDGTKFWNDSDALRWKPFEFDEDAIHFRHGSESGKIIGPPTQQ